MSLLAAAIVLVVHASLYCRDFIVDDAYISFRVVEQWTHGNGLVYNVGERVEAYSNFLWVALLAVIDRLGVALPEGSMILGTACSLATLVVVHRFTRRSTGMDVASWLLAATPAFAAWAVGGLETPLYALLVVAACTSFAIEEERGRGFASGALFALVGMTRPEGPVFAVIAFLWRAFRLRNERTLPRRQDVYRFAAFASIYGTYFVWRLAYYGHLLPNTVAAKTMGLHPKTILGGLLYQEHSLDAAGGLFFLALPIALALVRRDRSRHTLYFTSNVILYAALSTVEGKDWMPMQRVLVHTLPLVMILVNDGIAAIAKLDFARASVVAPAVAAAQAAFLFGRTVDEKIVTRLKESDAAAEIAYHRWTGYLARNVRPNDVIAVEVAGVPAYQAPLGARVIDMLGLADGHIGRSKLRADPWLKDIGFGRWDVDYILAAKPRFVQVCILGETSSGEPKTQFVGSALLLADPRFIAEYEPVREEGVIGIYVRKDTRAE